MSVTDATRSWTPWTTHELEVLKLHYPTYGPSWEGWRDLLPNRTPNAIWRQAYARGIVNGRRKGTRTLVSADAEVALASIAVSALDPERVEALREMVRGAR